MGVEAWTAVTCTDHLNNIGVFGVSVEQALGALPLRAGRNAHRGNTPYDIDGCLGRSRVGIRAKISSTWTMTLAGVLNCWVDILAGNSDEGVALVVAQVDVVGRAVLLDEVHLEDKRLML